MAYHEAVGRARKTPVRHQRDAVAEPPALDRRRHAEHLPHPRPADRAFAADHDDVAILDLAGAHCGEAGLLAVIDLGRPFEAQPRLAGELHHAAFGREIAVEHAIAAARLERLVDRQDHRLPRRFGRIGEGLEQAPSGDGRRVRDQPRLGEPAAEQRRSARLAHVRRHETAGGFEVGDHRGRSADLVEQVDVEIRLGDPSLARDGEEMEHEVGRSRRRRPRDGRVTQAGRGDELPRVAPGLQRLDEDAPRLLRRLRLVRMGRGNVVEPGRRQAEKGHRQRHRVGGELPAAGAGAGAGRGLHLAQARIVDPAGAMRADRLEHVLDGELPLAQPPLHDRAAVEDDARHIEPRRRHRRGRDRLVAADDEQGRVQRMATHRELRGIGDRLAAHQGGAHSAGPHRDPIGDDDRVEIDRRRAGRENAPPRMFGKALQVDVAGRDVRPGVDDRHHRPRHRRIVEAGGAQHGPRGGPCRAILHLTRRQGLVSH